MSSFPPPGVEVWRGYFRVRYGEGPEMVGLHEDGELLTPPQTECSRLTPCPLPCLYMRISRYWGVLVLSGCLFNSELGKKSAIEGCLFNSELGRFLNCSGDWVWE